MLLSDKQTEFVREAHHRWNFKGGATRSGKTYLDFRWVIPIRIRERIGKEGLTVILGVTKSTIERNVLEPMRNIYGDELVGTISSDNRIWLFGERCYALGAEKITQVSKIRGASIKYCYGDEVADWSIEVFELLKSRLDKAYSCFDGTFNPQYPSHWLKTFLDSDADIFSQTYTIDDNPFLPPEFIENLKREYAGSVYYKRYILGEWSLAEGMIYPSYSSALETPFTPPRWRDVFISIDYGTQNAFAALLWGKSEGVWHIFREYRYSGRDTQVQKTDEDYVRDMERFVSESLPEDQQRGVMTIIDPSAASFIAALRRSRLAFRVRKADNDVLDGIRDVAVCMQRGDVRIFDNLPELRKEFDGYVWDDKADDKPIKVNDHLMDALRYGVRTMRLVKPKEEYKSPFFKQGR